MSTLRDNENFVAESLQTYFKKLNKNVYFEKGEDPPDVCFYIDDTKVSVEITDLDENNLNSRRTVESGYLSFFTKINKEFESLIDERVQLHILFDHGYNKIKIIDKEFRKYLRYLIKNNKFQIGDNIKDGIDNVNFSISISKISKDGKKIVGGIIPSLESQGMSLDEKALYIVKNRIDDKNYKCQNVKKPIWLALFDNYFNKFTNFETQEHIEFYEDVLENIEDFGIFDKILIVFENKDVLEINRS